MPVQAVINPNSSKLNMVPKPSQNDVAGGSAFRVYDAQEKVPTNVKVGVFLTTLAGVALAMHRTFKVKELPMKNLKDYLTNFVKITYKEENNEVPWLVGRLAIGSVGGGLIGGALLDKKENMKAKVRESVIQLVGNIATPLGCVLGGMKLFEKYAEPKLAEKLKLSKRFEKAPNAIVSAICLVIGIVSGNKIGNYINKTVFSCDEKRTLKLSDMSPHIDDIATASTFVIPPEMPIGKVLTRIIPAALMIAGYSTGTAQESPERLRHNLENKAKSNITPNA